MKFEKDIVNEQRVLRRVIRGRKPDGDDYDDQSGSPAQAARREDQLRGERDAFRQQLDLERKLCGEYDKMERERNLSKLTERVTELGDLILGLRELCEGACGEEGANIMAELARIRREMLKEIEHMQDRENDRRRLEKLFAAENQRIVQEAAKRKEAEEVSKQKMDAAMEDEHEAGPSHTKSGVSWANIKIPKARSFSRSPPPRASSSERSPSVCRDKRRFSPPAPTRICRPLRKVYHRSHRTSETPRTRPGYIVIAKDRPSRRRFFVT